jgi:glycosyltransferase involved in cell wall biosynthesis
MSTVNFLLPGNPTEPIGGIKVVEEYTARLLGDGHSVRLLVPDFPVTHYGGRRRDRWKRTYLSRFRPAKHIRESTLRFKELARAVPSLEARHIPRADVTVATSWWTAFYASALPTKKGRAFHLVQHHETWEGTPACIAEAYRLPIAKLVIAKWLRDKVLEHAPRADVAYVPNGIKASVNRPGASDRDLDVLFMSHELPWKRTDLGAEVFQALRRESPHLRLAVFGRGNFPEVHGVERHGVLPPDEVAALYRRSSVFLHTSDREGWPLPPAEAMAAGCVLVASGNEGVREYAPSDAARLVAPGDPVALTNAVQETLADEGAWELRSRLGYETMTSEYSWEAAYARFVKAISLA